jgi:hypothetical protein
MLPGWCQDISSVVRCMVYEVPPIGRERESKLLYYLIIFCFVFYSPILHIRVKIKITLFFFSPNGG